MNTSSQKPVGIIILHRNGGSVPTFLSPWILLFVFILFPILSHGEIDSNRASPTYEQLTALGFKVSRGAAPGYVDDRSCGLANCHAAIYSDYRKTDKANSFYRPDPENLIEDFRNNHYYHEKSGRHYEMVLRDGLVFFKRWQLDDQGKPINQIELKVDWIQGAGPFGRAYFYQTPGGEIFQLPILWYKEDRRWGMAPGFNRTDHSGINRRVTRECQFCHNGYPEVPQGTDGYESPPTFPNHLPTGIGCQRCHGPGAEHAELALGGMAEQKELWASIVDPGWLPRELRNDVCYQCHMRPSLPTLAMTRFGRGDFSFKPGEPLNDYMVQIHPAFNSMQGGGRLRPYSHDRMELSHCYRQRDSLDCNTCHDPHRKTAESEKPAIYRKICLRCHQDHVSGSEEGLQPSRSALRSEFGEEFDLDDCTACHMPDLPSTINHQGISDHSIPRRPELKSVHEVFNEENPLQIDILLRTKVSDPDYLHSLSGIVRAGGGEEAVERLEKLLREKGSEDVEPWYILARAHLTKKQWRKAGKALRIILEKKPDSSLALEWMGIVMARLEERKESIGYMKKALKGLPNKPGTRFNLGLFLLAEGRIKEAEIELRKAVELRPNLANGWFFLGEIHRELERSREAVENYRRALEIEPSHLRSYRAIAEALEKAGKKEEAARYRRHGKRLAKRMGAAGSPSGM